MRRTRRPPLSSSGAVLASFAVIGLAACSAISSVTGSSEKKKQEEKAARVQNETMNLADTFVGEMLGTAGRIRAETPEQRLAILGWQTRQANAAYDIASGENPLEDAVHLAILVTLGRSVLEAYWVPNVFGDTARPMLSVYANIEPRSWSIVREFTTEEQETKIRSLVTEWRASHAEIHEVAAIRLPEIVGSSGDARALGSPGEALQTLGLDPFAGLDPAVAQVQRSRILAERTLYFAKRWPRILELMTRQLVLELAIQPPGDKLLADLDRASRAADSVAQTAGELPALVDRERDASIRQIMDALQAQEGQARVLAADIRQTLEAGGAAATALHGALDELNVVTARLTAPSPPPPPGTPPAPPFDIRDYTRALELAARTTRDLQDLLRVANQDAPRVATLVGNAGREAEVRGRALVDHAFWRALTLGLILIGAILSAAVAYRKLARP
jgi:hypothetical protein